MLDHNIKQSPLKGMLGMGGGINVYYPSSPPIQYDDPSNGVTSGTGWIIVLDGYTSYASSGVKKAIDVYGGNVHVMTRFIDDFGYNIGRIVFNSTPTLQDESSFYHSSGPIISGSLNNPYFFGIDGSNGDYYITTQSFNIDADWCAHAYRFNGSNIAQYFRESRNNSSADAYGGKGWLSGSNIFVSTHQPSSWWPGIVKLNSSGSVLASLQFNTGSFSDGVTSNGNFAWMLNRSNNDSCISKHNYSNLGVSWRYSYNNTYTTNQGNISVDSSDNLYIAGSLTNTSPKYGILRKINTNGVEQWARKSGNGIDDTAFYNVVYGTDGYIYALGYTMEGSTNRVGLIMKYNTSGVLQWSRRIKRQGINVVAHSIAIDTNNTNNVYIYCESGSNPMIVKLPTSGNPTTFGGEFELDTTVFGETSQTTATRTSQSTSTTTWNSYYDNATHNSNNQTKSTSLYYM